MSRKNGIDLFRLIGVFFLVCIHANYGDLDQGYVDVIKLLARWRIPFFFITTGFFLGPKIENDNLDFDKIKNNITNLISILIASSLVYLPINFYVGHFDFNIDNLLTGGFFHLWFLGALLFGYIFIWYLFHLKKGGILLTLSVVILLVALFTDSYDQFINKELNFFPFKFLSVIPYMYIGILLSKKESLRTRISNKLLIGIIIVGLAVQFFEAELFQRLFNYGKNSHQLLVGTIVAVIPLWLLSCNIQLKENRLSQWGNKHSLFIYLYHPIMLMLTYSILKRLVPSHHETLRVASPLLGFIFTLTFSIVLHKWFPRIFDFLNGNFKKKSAVDTFPNAMKEKIIGLSSSK